MRFSLISGFWGGTHNAAETPPRATQSAESDAEHEDEPEAIARPIVKFWPDYSLQIGNADFRHTSGSWTAETKHRHTVYSGLASDGRDFTAPNFLTCPNLPKSGGTIGDWVLVGSPTMWEARSVDDQLDTATALVTPIVEQAFRDRVALEGFVKTAVDHGFPNKNQHLLLAFAYAKAQDDTSFNYLDFTLYSKDVLGRPLAANTVYGCIEELTQRKLLEAAVPTNDQNAAGRPSKVFRITSRGRAAFEASALLSHQLADALKGDEAA